jgi:hypothetical protein
MTRPLPIPTRSRRRIWATAVLAMALLTGTVGTALAQDASDSTEIDIVVRPAGVAPVPAPTPTVAPGAINEPPPVTPNLPILLAPPVLGALQAPMPGTVSAQIALVQPHGASDRLDDSVATLIVRDDRGTATGWDVSFTSAAPKEVWWQPGVMENRDSTIRRLIPRDAISPDQVDGISGGRTLGPYELPIPVLAAELGSGSGLYQQPLIIVVPLFERDNETGMMFVQIPFAP